MTDLPEAMFPVKPITYLPRHLLIYFQINHDDIILARVNKNVKGKNLSTLSFFLKQEANPTLDFIGFSRSPSITIPVF
jgi:hypothetical protein